MKTVLVTGAAGFIGLNLTKMLLKQGYRVLALDCYTQSSNGLGCLNPLLDEYPTTLEITTTDITNGPRWLLNHMTHHDIDGVFHLAAESHVDTSIRNPRGFLDTNITGTFNLLQAALEHYIHLDDDRRNAFRFVHVSTDEVYGSLTDFEQPFHEESPYKPNSPYAASKAASDHWARCYYQTFGLPTITTHCSNNYGPHQNTEKLIPKIITMARDGEPLPVYGDGTNVREWIYVEDHCEALIALFELGDVGEVYNIGSHNEYRNLEIVDQICDLLDNRLGTIDGNGPRRNLISFVEDRKGHDYRYAICSKKIENAIGWKAKTSFQAGMMKTIDWYLNQ